MKVNAKRNAPRNKKPVKSLIKDLRILDTLSDGVDGLGITDLSGVLKTPKSTVHRLVATLEIAGYVAFDPPTNSSSKTESDTTPRDLSVPSRVRWDCTRRTVNAAPSCTPAAGERGCDQLSMGWMTN